MASLPDESSARTSIPNGFLLSLRDAMVKHREKQRKDSPNYYISSDSDDAGPDPLQHLLDSHSTLHSFHVGTGLTIFNSVLVPAILSARREIIFVTCFWTASDSRDAIRHAIKKIAANRRAYMARDGGAAADIPILRIRICFSTGDTSMISTAFRHRAARSGLIRHPDTWATDSLGLPSREEIESARIDLNVKSGFFLPVSVLHPKFVVVDRQRAWIPSCNASWEPWFEGCVEISGENIICSIMNFYRSVWEPTLGDIESDGCPPCEPFSVTQQGRQYENRLDGSVPGACGSISFSAGTVAPSIFLPSPHHQNPRLSLKGIFPFPFLRQLISSALSALLPKRSRSLSGSANQIIAGFETSFPPTPLNLTLHTLIHTVAQKSIFIQTPNITSQPFVAGIVAALARGVDVTIVLSRRLMVLEQIVTALGWTSGWAASALIRAHRRLLTDSNKILSSVDGDVLEAGLGNHNVGRLKINYYRPSPSAPSASSMSSYPPEPVRTHLKLTIIDGEYSIFGSGNMDRASWFTSQEIGLMVYSPETASGVLDTLQSALLTRTDVIYDS